MLRRKIVAWNLFALALGGLALTAPIRVQAQAPTPKAPVRAPKVAADSVEQFAQERAKTTGEKLGLNAEQVTELSAVNAGALKQLQILFNTRASDKAAARLKMQDVLANRQRTIEKILTPEQLEKYREMLPKEMGAVATELINRKLKLTSAQITRLNYANEQVIAKVGVALQKSDKMAQNKGIADAKAYKDKQYKNILTAAQNASLQQMKYYMGPTNVNTDLKPEDTRTNPYWGTPAKPYMGDLPSYGWGSPTIYATGGPSVYIW